jgi:hypothetical protein
MRNPKLSGKFSHVADLRGHLLFGQSLPTPDRFDLQTFRRANAHSLSIATTWCAPHHGMPVHFFRGGNRFGPCDKLARITDMRYTLLFVAIATAPGTRLLNESEKKRKEEAEEKAKGTPDDVFRRFPTGRIRKPDNSTVCQCITRIQ